jgi:hypothetical protein
MQAEEPIRATRAPAVAASPYSSTRVPLLVIVYAIGLVLFLAVEPTKPWILMIVTGLVALGTDGILRTHPHAVLEEDIAWTAPLLFLPTLMCLAAGLFLEDALSLRETLYFRNARRIAARLLAHEETALEAWGHMVLKPALRGLATPLHQDESYWEPAFDYHAVGAWLPLEDVDGDNGCMCFVPGSHRGDVLPHRHLDDDPRLHLLEVDVAHDTRSMVAVPLRVGGATFHHPRTLQATAPNRRARPRRGFANEFLPLPSRRPVRAAKPWLDDQKRVWTEHKSAGTPARPAKE